MFCGTKWLQGVFQIGKYLVSPESGAGKKAILFLYHTYTNLDTGSSLCIILDHFLQINLIQKPISLPVATTIDI